MGMTSVLQRLDIWSNKLLKDSVQKLYTNWMQKDQAPMSLGRMKRTHTSPTDKWAPAAWCSLLHDMVIRSLKKCFIWNHLEGTNDDSLRGHLSTQPQKARNSESFQKRVVLSMMCIKGKMLSLHLLVSHYIRITLHSSKYGARDLSQRYRYVHLSFPKAPDEKQELAVANNFVSLKTEQ